jgi:hypothetical protein
VQRTNERRKDKVRGTTEHSLRAANSQRANSVAFHRAFFIKELTRSVTVLLLSAH